MYMASTTKDDRLQIRLSPEQKRTIEEAAETAHLSVSAFVLQAAERQADAMLLERTLVRLSPGAAEAFAVALERPATVNHRLAEALSRPPSFSWLA